MRGDIYFAFSAHAATVLLLATMTLMQGSIWSVYAACSDLNYCNGHGQCNGSKCYCYEGWDVSLDCSQQSCPSALAWADLPDESGEAHREAECSNRGLCNRATGRCKCFSGYTGNACQRRDCPNGCSGHGRCLSLRELTYDDEALPFTNLTYTNNGTLLHYRHWDHDHIYGCVCDSSWAVGLKAGQRQEPEWFGPDCSLRHCPSGDNPRTESDETDCSGVSPTGPQSSRVGDSGNLCHIDCSQQGVCDYKTGECKCFNGYYGLNCNVNDALAVRDWASALSAQQAATSQQSIPSTGEQWVSNEGSIADGWAEGEQQALPDLPWLGEDFGSL